MKFFSIGIHATALLFGINSVSQNNLKEQLKTLEQSSITTKLDTIVTSNFDLKSTNAYDAFGLNVNQNITSLLAFIGTQKQISTATFETTITPYLENKTLEWNETTLYFTDDENLIFEVEVVEVTSQKQSMADEQAMQQKMMQQQLQMQAMQEKMKGQQQQAPANK